jgi:hypothetical protein
MQAIGPAPPSTRRRIRVGVTGIVAFALLVLLNFFPGWQAMPFLTDGMGMAIGMIDLVLAVVIISNVIYQLSDSPGVHAGVHLVIAVALIPFFITLMRTFPFALSASPWPRIVHDLLNVGALAAFCAIWVVIWQMVGLNYNAARHGH